MSIYLVNQGKTYRHERDGGYIWSPKVNSAGKQNKGYSMMKEVRKGDFLIHNSGAKLSAISVVKENCKSGGQPQELKDSPKEYNWNDDGWIVFTHYYEFEIPLRTSDLVEWAVQNYCADSAFQVNGKLRLQYLCHLAKPHAEYLLRKALLFENRVSVISVLQDALSNVTSSNDTSPGLEHKDKTPLRRKEENTTQDLSSIRAKSTVFHKTYGKGTVALINDQIIGVFFGTKLAYFSYPDAFRTGELTV